ncbi:hypothetical protein BDZ91DRAFT_710575 [Kalaharituber pfeilii]|nr:hypothetical protein BDZ91DRAFT_710575 [Kalaharituber pfeilii]
MSKYASLPDLDISQDIYETPDLADDVSTLPTTLGARTTSPAFSDDDTDYRPPPVPHHQLHGHYRHSSTASAALADSIDRTRLQPNAARSRFASTELDASNVDFSDRVGARRARKHGYVASSKKKEGKGRRRRRGVREDIVGTADEYDDDEQEEEEETLEGKLARLRREVEELKGELATREEKEEKARALREEAAAAAMAAETAGEGDTEESKETSLPPAQSVQAEEGIPDNGIDGKRLRTGITELSDALETLQMSSVRLTEAHTRPAGRAEANLTRKIASALSVPAAQAEPTDGPQIVCTKQSFIPTLATFTEYSIAGCYHSFTSQPTYTIHYAPTFRKHHALSRAADFDNRLTALERLLGASSSHLANLDKQLPANAIIPTLDDLARQITVLTSSNQPFVEALTRRVKTLTDQAEKLAEARRTAAKAAVLEGNVGAATGAATAAGAGAGVGLARRATVSTTLVPTTDEDASGLAGPSRHRETKINALYGVLPKIQQLGPLLPSVLDRLRSLRAIHADAGRAAEGLEGIEKRQEEMAVEIQRWRESLEKVEG